MAQRLNPNWSKNVMEPHSHGGYVGHLEHSKMRKELVDLVAHAFYMGRTTMPAEAREVAESIAVAAKLLGLPDDEVRELRAALNPDNGSW